MPAIGDIVRIFAPVAGKAKYHLCILVGTDGDAHKFIFLNSDPGYDGCYDVDCARVPCLPASRTGRTVFSFTMVVRYTDHQLKLYRAAKLGSLDAAVAAELLGFARTVSALSGTDRRAVLAALRQISNTQLF